MTDDQLPKTPSPTDIWYLSPLSTRGTKPGLTKLQDAFHGRDSEGRASVGSATGPMHPTPSRADASPYGFPDDGEASPRSPCARRGAFSTVSSTASLASAAASPMPPPPGGLPPMPRPPQPCLIPPSDSFGSDPELEEASAPASREDVVVTPMYSPGTVFTPLAPAQPSPSLAGDGAEREAAAAVDALVSAAKRAALPGQGLPGTPGATACALALARAKACHGSPEKLRALRRALVRAVDDRRGKTSRASAILRQALDDVRSSSGPTPRARGLIGEVRAASKELRGAAPLPLGPRPARPDPLYDVDQVGRELDALARAAAAPPLSFSLGVLAVALGAAYYLA